MFLELFENHLFEIRPNHKYLENDSLWDLPLIPVKYTSLPFLNLFFLELNNRRSCLSSIY